MIDNQTLATIGVFALPVVWLLSRVNWAALWKRLPDVTPEPTPTAPPTEADFLPGDYAALERLKARAIRWQNPTMDDSLTVVSEQFMVIGEGWETE